MSKNAVQFMILIYITCHDTKWALSGYNNESYLDLVIRRILKQMLSCMIK